MKNKISVVRLIILVVVALILYYFMLPPLNLTSPLFWLYAFLLYFVYMFTSILKLVDIRQLFIEKITISKKNKVPILPFLVFPTVIILLVFVNIIMSPLFQSSSYYKRITINEEGNFTEDIKPVDFNALPLLDKDSSQKLGDRVMGQLPELVSQFDVSELYTQINYNNNIVRVTPLEYNGLIKYFANRKDGVKGYIVVNSVTGEASLTKLDKGMKYMPSAYFFENLYRKLRIDYPTLIFDEANFEIDNDGNPYWIVPTIKYSGVGLRREITGVVILDPITGKSNKYSVGEIPTWVDHVYPADLIIEEVDDWGQYKNGYLNSVFSQKNVVQTTEGYNYTVMNDDVYLYTGITSKVADEANVGFILTNMRTKETNYYAVPGAEEYSAMASAEGQVQQMNYRSTFPLLINLNNKPTYLVSLKDNAGLVKMYGFIDVTDYQKVVVTESSEGIVKAAQKYLGNNQSFINNESTIKKDITIKSVKDVIINGNTYYYLVDTNNKKYRVNINVSEFILPFIKENSSITVYYEQESDVIEIIKIDK